MRNRKTVDVPEAVLRQARTVSPKYRALYLRSLAGELPSRQAIRVKCLECVAWQRVDGGRDRIAECAARQCPLWALRPYQMGQESLHDSPAGTSATQRSAADSGPVPASPVAS